MLLFKDNKESYKISQEEIITRFKQSDIFKDKTRDIDVRLALFITSDEPKGMQSQFIGSEFNKLLITLKSQSVF